MAFVVTTDEDGGATDAMVDDEAAAARSPSRYAALFADSSSSVGGSGARRRMMTLADMEASWRDSWDPNAGTGGGGGGDEEGVCLVQPLWRLSLMAVADHFDWHSRELLNVSLPARGLLLTHLKARFLPPHSRRFRPLSIVQIFIF